METGRRSSSARRRAILDAAHRLVLREGPRATTMAAIAREAGVAKPTLYAYFREKQAVLSALAEAIAAEAASAFEAALAADDDTATRVGNAVAAKHRTLARSLGGSPHAGNLAAEGGTTAAPLRALDQRIEAQVIEELTRAGVVRARPLAQLLLAAAEGVSRRATAPAEIGPAIRLLADRLLRPAIAAEP